MSNFPFYGAKENYINNTQNELPLLREIAWDFKNNTYLLDENTNDFVIIEGVEAIKVWIYKVILTVRYEYPIYSWDYGTELINLVSQKYSRALAESEAFRFIKEALEIHPYILSVDNKQIKFRNNTLSIYLYVNTVYGGVEINV